MTLGPIEIKSKAVSKKYIKEKETIKEKEKSQINKGGKTKSFETSSNVNSNEYSITNEKSRLVKIISQLLNSEEKPPKKSIFKFENTTDAAEHNSKILAACNFDYEKLLTKQKGTSIYYGSEFRSIINLQKLLKFHTNWNRVKKFLSEGTDTSFIPMNEEELKNDCIKNIERGNHKSSFKSEKATQFLNKTYSKEVRKGWMIPLTVEIILKLKNTCVIPVGVVSQLTINESGESIEKMRLTHDCSWPGPSQFSVNNRINEELLAPLQYGRCFYRVLHHIQNMRYNNPSKKILMAKHDLDSAYRRLHWHARCTLLCITIISNIAYLLTRLCFGISSGPSEWCLISETLVDFAAILIKDKTWDPQEFFNPKEEIPTIPNYEDDRIPLKKGKKILFKLPNEDTYIEGYIDDLLSIILAMESLILRAVHAIPLMCYILFRPVHKSEPLERSDIIGTAKLIAEGGLSEVKTFLGWIIDTRRMRVSLPKLKALKWINEIDQVLETDKVNAKTLEKLLGKLNHAAFVIPFSRYFLNRTRYSQGLAEKYGPQKLSKGTREDLILFKDFLAIMSTHGSSISNITFTLPDYVCWSDASSYGLGGFNHEGLAWRWEIPQDLIGSVSINLLEFIASVVTIFISLKNKEKDSKILAFTDNSSALGWLHKASFHPASQSSHDKVARKFAQFMIKNEFSLYSEHIKGDNNNVADALSRNFNLNNTDLISFLHASYPKQMPKDFKIIEVPENIASWILSTLREGTSKMESKDKPPKKHKHILKNGTHSATKQESQIDFCQTSKISKKRKSSVPSQQQFAGITLENLQRKYCLERRSGIQSDMFVRISGLTDSVTQGLINPEPPLSSYQES